MYTEEEQLQLCDYILDEMIHLLQNDSDLKNDNFVQAIVEDNLLIACKQAFEKFPNKTLEEEIQELAENDRDSLIAMLPEDIKCTVFTEQMKKDLKEVCENYIDAVFESDISGRYPHIDFSKTDKISDVISEQWYDYDIWGSDEANWDQFKYSLKLLDTDIANGLYKDLAVPDSKVVLEQPSLDDEIKDAQSASNTLDNDIYSDKSKDLVREVREKC